MSFCATSIPPSVWAQNGWETPAERRYNPAFSKKDLFRLGYIAEHSGHSTGAAVDLTLVDLNAGNSLAFDPNKTYADCTAPADARTPEGSVDMGTGYDCSDLKAHTAATSITSAQRPSAKCAGCGHGEARSCKLFQGVVAFFAAGGGRARV